MKIPNWAVGLEVTNAATDRLRFQYTSSDLMIPRPSRSSLRRGELLPKRAPDHVNIKFEVAEDTPLVFVEACLDVLTELPESLHVVIRQRMNMDAKPIDVLISELRRRLFAAAAIELGPAGE